jgi:hypothetical protein
LAVACFLHVWQGSVDYQCWFYLSKYTFSCYLDGVLDVYITMQRFVSIWRESKLLGERQQSNSSHWCCRQISGWTRHIVIHHLGGLGHSCWDWELIFGWRTRLRVSWGNDRIGNMDDRTGWAISYLPFGLIARAMWNYHYFIPLLSSRGTGAVATNALAPNARVVPIILIAGAFACWWLYYPIPLLTWRRGCCPVGHTKPPNRQGTSFQSKFTSPHAAVLRFWTTQTASSIT